MGSAKIIPPNTLFLPYQARWIADRSRLKLAVKSRQVGWTWATAYSLVERKAQADAQHDAWISSRDESQAKLFLRDCKNFAKTLNIAAKDLGQPFIENDGRGAYTLEFLNGVQIHSISSSTDAQVGKRGDRILDEFAVHADPRELYAVAYPGITWGGSLEIFSTQRGADNFFNTLISEIVDGGNPRKFSFHKVTLQDALEQGLLYKLQAKSPISHPIQDMDEAAYFDDVRSGCDTETFLREYMCQPSDEARAFLSYDQIVSCEFGLNAPWQWSIEELEKAEDDLYVGVDVGRDHDFTVIWVVEKSGSTFYTRRVEVFEKTPFDIQEKALYQILDLRKVQRCCIDKSGIGRQFCERASYRYGAFKVEGVAFTGALKEEIAYPVRAAFEDRRIRVPNDPAIRSDLRAIRKDSTASGNVRFTADRGKNGHSDRFWALALALHAGKHRRWGGAMVC